MRQSIMDELLKSQQALKEQQKSKHPESFNWMYYANDDGSVGYWIYNSRDGVTPFCCSIGGVMLQHTQWNKDIKAPNYKPKEGDLVWRHWTREEAEADMKHRVEIAPQYVRGDTPEEKEEFIKELVKQAGDDAVKNGEPCLAVIRNGEMVLFREDIKAPDPVDELIQGLTRISGMDPWISDVEMRKLFADTVYPLIQKYTKAASIILLLIMFPILSFCQKVKVVSEKVDRFEKVHTKETNFTLVAYKPGYAIRVKGSSFNGHSLTLTFRVTLPKVFSIGEGQKLQLLLEDGSVVDLLCIWGGVADYSPYYENDHWFGDFVYHISDDQIKQVLQNPVVSLRVWITGNLVTFEKVKKRNQQDLAVVLKSVL